MKQGLEIAGEEADAPRPARAVARSAPGIGRVGSRKRYRDELTLDDRTNFLLPGRIAQPAQGAAERTPVARRAPQLDRLQRPVRGLREQPIATPEQGRQGLRHIVTGPTRQRPDLDRRPVDGDRGRLGLSRRLGFLRRTQPSRDPLRSDRENGRDQRPTHGYEEGDPRPPSPGDASLFRPRRHAAETLAAARWRVRSRR